MSYYVYILSNQKNGTLYIGVTRNLINRIYEHKMKHVKGYTNKYDLKLLIYYEPFEDIQNAISREKQLKKWNRQWKVHLIEKMNLFWKDLYNEIL